PVTIAVFLSVIRVSSFQGSDPMNTLIDQKNGDWTSVATSARPVVCPNSTESPASRKRLGNPRTELCRLADLRCRGPGEPDLLPVTSWLTSHARQTGAGHRSAGYKNLGCCLATLLN